MSAPACRARLGLVEQVAGVPHRHRPRTALGEREAVQPVGAGHQADPHPVVGGQDHRLLPLASRPEGADVADAVGLEQVGGAGQSLEALVDRVVGGGGARVEAHPRDPRRDLGRRGEHREVLQRLARAGERHLLVADGQVGPADQRPQRARTSGRSRRARAPRSAPRPRPRSARPCCARAGRRPSPRWPYAVPVRARAGAPGRTAPAAPQRPAGRSSGSSVGCVGGGAERRERRRGEEDEGRQNGSPRSPHVGKTLRGPQRLRRRLKESPHEPAHGTDLVGTGTGRPRRRDRRDDRRR